VNRIGERGAEAVAQLCIPKFSIHTLSIAHNQLGDKGANFIVGALIIAEKDLFSSEEYKDPDAAVNSGLYSRASSTAVQMTPSNNAPPDENLIQNSTITDLDISHNNIGPDTLESISVALKSSVTLLHLRTDCMFNRRSNDFNHIFNQCRIFNKTLQTMSLSDTRLSISAFEHAMLMFDGISVLSRLNMARCEITATHLRKGFISISLSKHLSHLDLSGNSLGDQGIGFLCSGLTGRSDSTQPPVRHLDLSGCGFTIAGALKVLDTISLHPIMRYLDISDNNLSGGDRQRFAQSVGSSTLEHINLSRCQLGSTSSHEILQALRMSTTMKVLIIAENDIQDSIDQSLSELLTDNYTLRVLDLGFNRISDRGVIASKKSLHVTSKARLERKLNELHINLVGNKCDPYSLELPNMARSKNTLRYGAELLTDQSHHISDYSINDYWSRKKLHGQLLPSGHATINFIS
jgi:Ran GTPase-activating protein (RanGAP) involved in mRNA processing and transport